MTSVKKSGPSLAEATDVPTSSGGERRAKEQRHPASFKTRWLTAVRESDLGDRERLVAFALGTWMSSAGGCFPSLGAIAAGARRHVATVCRALDELEAGGWIDRDRGGGRGRSTTYQASIPSHIEARVSGPNCRSLSTRKLSQPDMTPSTESLAPSASGSKEVSIEGTAAAVAADELAPPIEVTRFLDRIGVERLGRPAGAA